MRGNEFLGNLIERNVKRRQTALCVSFQIGEVICHGKVEKRQPVVKNRSKSVWLIGLVFHHQTEVVQMPVGVVNQRIKDHHIAECIEIIFAKIPQIFGDLPDAFSLAEPPHRNKGVVNIGKEFAHATKAAFPLGKCVRNMIKPHRFCNLMIQTCSDPESAANAPAINEPMKKFANLMADYKFRTVVGSRRLSEKVRIFDAELDDFAVEIFKAWIWRSIDGEKELFFDNIEDGKLEFVVGYDNILPYMISNGKFPTVAVDLEKMGHRAVAALVDKEPLPKVQNITPQLIFR